MLTMRCSWRQRQILLQFSVILLLLIPTLIQAQVVAGAISGSVTDSSGAAVAGARVTVTNQSTMVSQSTTTDERGFYSVEGLTVGQYSVSVSKEGFEEILTHNIQLNPGQRRANSVVLHVGSATAKVVVTADREQVNTQTSESGGTISGEQIQNLMLNGRNFETLALAIPGVTSTQGSDQITPSALGTGSALIVSGNSAEYNTYTIDGMYDMDTGSPNTFNVVPMADGIEEFSVLKDNYSAKYGFVGSGQIVVITKSGTDTFHGSAWDYLRNTALNASNYFSTTPQVLHQNIFGYTLGGPLYIPRIYNTDRKKTFFFAASQWYVINAGSVVRGAVFPQAMRNGDFSQSPTLPSTGILTLDSHSQALLASEGKVDCVSGPTTLNPACFDPVAIAVMNADVPLPNNPAGGFQNYINQRAATTSQLDHQFRVDHYINQNNLLTARVMYEPIKNGFPYNAWSGLPYATMPSSWYQRSWNSILRLQTTITPSLLNTFGLGETEDRETIGVQPGVGALPAGVSISQSFPQAPHQDLIPNIAIANGWTGNGVNSQPIVAGDGEGLVADDLSWVKGSHVLQTGALYMFGIKRQTVFTSPEGTFSFSGVHTGDPAADYMLGLDTTYSQNNTENEGVFHYRQGEAYVQDDWRVDHRLTFNLGVRWMYFSNETVSGDQVTDFDEPTYNAAEAPVVNPDGSFQVNGMNQPLNQNGQVANLLDGLVFAGKNGVSSGFYAPVKTNFGPRIGFAYDVFGDGKTSIRSGYGIGYARVALQNIYPAFGINPPYNQNANVLNSLLSDGTAGTTLAPTPQSLFVIPFRYRAGQIQSYSLTLQHELKANMVASLAYAGGQSRHLQGGTDNNFPLPVVAPSHADCLSAGQGASTSYQFDPCINAGISSPDYSRPYKGYSSMNNLQYDDGMSNYNSLQADITYRSPEGSQFGVSYTHSKILSTLAGQGARNGDSVVAFPQDPYNFHAEYGPPDYDFPNDITATWVFNLPTLSQAAKPVKVALGDWSFAGLGMHQSGFALTPRLTTGDAGLARRPNQVSPIHQIGKLSEWFDTTSFAAPDFGFFGNATNGSIRGPGYTSFNISLYKTFLIKDRLKAQFRAEAFNVANHPNFIGVDTGLGDGSYAQVIGAGDPRIMEFAVKLLF